MSRYSNLRERNTIPNKIPLPVINWGAINRSAPVHFPLDYGGKDAPLPEADIFIVTWTTAEWSALDHVFFESETERYSDNYEFEYKWLKYQKNAPKGGDFPLWGEYQMVGIDNVRGEQLKVLLFHSEAHLAYSPYLTGLTTMLKQIIDEVKPQCFISIGTAGGCNISSFLGDTVVTNAGYVDLKLPQNQPAYNHQTITGSWFPDSELYQVIQENLLLKLNAICSWTGLENMVVHMHKKFPFTSNYNLPDLINELITPERLGTPKIDLCNGIPLKTTDFYYIATSNVSDKQYAVLEMDDAIIAELCQDAGIDFAFYRNISDPLVPVLDKKGNKIPAEVRDKWSGEIYSNFGFFTSYNGALACYAGVAGCSVSPRNL